MSINAFPLQWPTGWKRHDTSRSNRRSANFKTGRHDHDRMRRLSIEDALQRVLQQLAHMGTIDRQDVVVSTNVPTRLDGFPRGGLAEPGDPGVAVYWQEPSGTRRVMAVDAYDRVADNLAAIAATLDAMRAIERHGGAAILERAFTGFVALPAPGAAREWHEVLGVAKSASVEDARAAWRRLASANHPDRGGSDARMAEVNAAWVQAQEALS